MLYYRQLLALQKCSLAVKVLLTHFLSLLTQSLRFSSEDKYPWQASIAFLWCSDLAGDASELISFFSNGPMGDVYIANTERIIEVQRTRELETAIKCALPPFCTKSPSQPHKPNY